MIPAIHAPTWLLWALVAVVSWGVWAVIGKLIGDGLTPAQSQALSVIGMLPVMGILARAAWPRQRSGIGIALAAGVVACFGNVAYYQALNVGGRAATVVSLTALYPLVTVVLALAILKERLNPVQFVGLLLSLGSITIFNISSVDGFLTGWVGYAMAPIFFWGIAGLLQKMAADKLSGESATFWFLVAFVPIGFLLLLWEPTRSVAPRLWGLAVLLGLFFSVGNLAILFAFARGGNASVIAPLTGLYPAVSIPIAILFLGEKVTGREWLGIALALISVAALAWEGKKNRCDQSPNG